MLSYPTGIHKGTARTLKVSMLGITQLKLNRNINFFLNAVLNLRC